ncbi:ankyrin repeat-containing domain protein [Apiospora phragmitis]|uniref:Ankyrin repeat-containing domain protein n=1 Tax=Apiospora phragmitis TaxID=2905665 RepID=A0ABR1VQA6_9PEZI
MSTIGYASLALQAKAQGCRTQGCRLGAEDNQPDATMDEDRGRQGPSKADRVGVGNADHSVIAGNFSVDGNVGFAFKGSADTTNLNSVVANSLSIGGDVKYTYLRSPGAAVSPSRVAQRLRKLARLDSLTKHRRLEETAQAVPNTGDWILNDPTFLRWQAGEFKHLWCYGKPGVGKTVLAAKIIRRLRDTVVQRGIQDQQMRGVLYVYFDYQQRDNQNPAAILADLLSQLLCQKPFVSLDTTRMYNEWGESEELLNHKGYLSLLISEAAVFHQVYLVLDGLDEYFDETNENRPHTLMGIVSQLQRNFKIIVTSRDRENRFDTIDFGKPIHIQATNQDLAAFFEWKINQSEVLKQAMATGDTRKDGSWSKHHDEFVTKARGNFLIAQLQMKALERDTDQNVIENCEGNSSYFYEGALRRIRGQRDSNKKMALAALNWVCYAARPLSISEFSHAVAGHQAAGRVDVNTLEAICAGLIIVDGSGIVRLFHYTAHEFRGRKAVVRFQDSHPSLARRCLIDLLERPIDDTSGHSHQISSHRGDVAAWKLVTELLGDQRKISESTECMENIPSHLKSDVTALHISTFFGSKGLVLHSINKLAIHIDTGAYTGHTATHWAVIFQQQRILQVLLESGANANAQDAKGRTPLHLAISNHDESSTRILLQYSQELDGSLEDKKGFTSLRFAAREGHLWAIKLLLPICANTINSEDQDGYSALRWSLKMGHESIVRLLIDAGADINTPSPHDGWLILSEAASCGNQRVGLIRFLLLERPDLHIDLHRQDWAEMAPIEWAVLYGGSEVAYLLLKAGADPSIRDKEGRTLLHRLIEFWPAVRDKTLLWLLIEHRCALELRDDAQDWTPLQLAIARANMSAAWLLVHGGASLGGQDRQGQTPLHTAVTSNQALMVGLLLDQGADYEVLDNNDYAPLHAAAALDGHAVMAAFLSRGKGTNVRNKSGLTPLHVAVMKQRAAAVQLLLQHGADPDLSDRAGRTPLYWALVKTKSREAVAALVRATRQLGQAADYEQQSYLHLAALSGEFALVQTVLAAGTIPVDQQDARGRTPLHAAIVDARNRVVACHLVLQGADVNLQDDDGCSALHHAAALGDKDLVPTLVARNGDRQLLNKKGHTPMAVAELAGHGELRWA